MTESERAWYQRRPLFLPRRYRQSRHPLAIVQQHRDEDEVGRAQPGGRTRERAQVSLPTLAIALLVLTTVAGLGIALAENAFAGADRQPDERRVAVALSERLVSEQAPLTVRTTVVNNSSARALTASRLRHRYPVVGDRAVTVRLGERTLVDTGSTRDGTTIRRLVLVRDRQPRTYEPAFNAENATTLPRRTDRIRLVVRPPQRTTVRAVRANGRVVLRNTSGLRGAFTVDASRFETTQLQFETNQSLTNGDVRVTYFPEQTTKATLEVTVSD